MRPKQLLQACLAVILLFSLFVLGFFWQSAIPLQDLKVKYMDSTSAFLSLNGMEVHYRDAGNPNDTIPIVLIHGTGSSLHTFDDWTSSLSKTRRVIRMDLPAYGLTGPFPDRDYSIAHYVSFVEDFLSALNIKQCIIAGNSLGGQIAWNVTLVQPDLVDKLILIDAAGYPIHSKSVPIAFRVAKVPFLNQLMTYLTPRSIVRSSVENVFHDKSKVTDELVDRFFDLTLRAGNRQAFVDRLVLESNNEPSHRISEIEQPTLVLWGAEDYLIPVDNGHRFHAELPNSILVIIQSSGHTPMEESAQESLESVLEFLSTSR